MGDVYLGLNDNAFLIYVPNNGDLPHFYAQPTGSHTWVEGHSRR